MTIRTGAHEGNKPHEFAIKFDPKLGMTEQSHLKNVNVNSIMSKYTRTGVLDHLSKHQGTYVDLTVTDFNSALELLERAEDSFMDLPSEVRNVFDNDPRQLIEFHDVAPGTFQERLLALGEHLDPRTRKITIPDATEAPVEPIPADPAAPDAS